MPLPSLSKLYESIRILNALFVSEAKRAAIKEQLKGYLDVNHGDLKKELRGLIDLVELQSFINSGLTEKAMTRIPYLNKNQFEYNKLGLEGNNHILDMAIEQGDIEAIDAIVKGYNALGYNVQLLPLDYTQEDIDNFSNSARNIINDKSINHYKTLMDLEKEKYLNKLNILLKELKIAGVTMLLQNLDNADIKSELSKALTTYKNGSRIFVMSAELDSAVEKAITTVKANKQTALAYKKSQAAIAMANTLAEKVREVKNDPNIKLEYLKESLNDELSEKGGVLSLHRGFLAIVDRIRQFLGVSLEPADVKKRTAWQFFRTSSAEKVDAIADTIDKMSKPK